MTQAQHLLLVGILLLLIVWLLWVWFGYEADLTKNPRNVYFAASAAHNQFLSSRRPQPDNQRLQFLKKIDHLLFVELIKLGFQQVDSSIQVELITRNKFFTLLNINVSGKDSLWVACSQLSLRKYADVAKEFGQLCASNQTPGILVHLGMTNPYLANQLYQAYTIQLLSGSRLLYLLTGQSYRISRFYPFLQLISEQSLHKL